ncbi:hypothetical protein OF83DRAFT_1177743 [Amylostereum chailletii]|nr:hypothetical protein OF83DRAFT_1177743 [Amylostereum chailletii]
MVDVVIPRSLSSHKLGIPEQIQHLVSWQLRTAPPFSTRLGGYSNNNGKVAMGTYELEASALAKDRQQIRCETAFARVDAAHQEHITQQFQRGQENNELYQILSKLAIGDGQGDGDDADSQCLAIANFCYGFGDVSNLEIIPPANQWWLHLDEAAAAAVPSPAPSQ